MSTAPIVAEHEGLLVVRDDLYPGGTKARFIPPIFSGVEEVVYAGPAEGGAQTALATVARALGKKATLFVAKRKQPHARAHMAKSLGAKVFQVTPGHLSVVRARARAYCRATPGALLAPFGFELPFATDAIASAAHAIGVEPDEVWCAAGSGVLSRGLAAAWPRARRFAVQVGRTLQTDDVGGATIIVHELPFSKALMPAKPAFPSDPHYDAKAYDLARRRRGAGRVLFWNVAGPAAAEQV